MFRVPATITKVETMSDRSIKLIVRTQELMASDKAELMELDNQLGHFVFAPAEERITEADIPTEKLERGEKSPSQRLRAVYFRQWEQMEVKPGAKKPDFELFYRVKLERLIEAEKGKLNPDV